MEKIKYITPEIEIVEFQTEDIEYYRTKKIPSTGHFIQEKDKAANSLPGQLVLGE